MEHLALIALLLVPAAVAAQQKSEQPEAKKSVPAAFALELAVPMAGHIYVGKPVRGLSPTSLFAGGAGLIVWGLRLTNELGGGDQPTGAVGLLPMIGGVALMGIAKVWGVTSATHAAVQHNRSLRIGTHRKSAVPCRCLLRTPGRRRPVRPAGGGF